MYREEEDQLMKAILVCAILVMDVMFLIAFFSDCRKNRQAMKDEPGNSALLSVYLLALYFCTSFGISDFAINSAVYTRFRLVRDEDLPGTLIAEGTIPVAFMAISYLSFVEIDLLTLLLPMLAQLLGSYLGPRITFRLSTRVIKSCVCIGLFLAVIMMLLSKLSLLPQPGVQDRLTGWRLAVCTLLAFCAGILNNIGIGSFSVMLALLGALGLNSLAAYPIMMASAALSTPIGSVQFIRRERYSRKLTLLSLIFGSIGAVLAVFVVTSINLKSLQWIIMVILLYSAYTIFRDLVRTRKAD